MSTPTTPAKPRKPSGWNGSHGDLFWTRSRKHGCQYKCQTCGKEQNGTYGDKHPYMHRPDCARLAPKVAAAPVRTAEDARRDVDALLSTATLAQLDAALAALRAT